MSFNVKGPDNEECHVWRVVITGALVRRNVFESLVHTCVLLVVDSPIDRLIGIVTMVTIYSLVFVNVITLKHLICIFFLLF